MDTIMFALAIGFVVAAVGWLGVLIIGLVMSSSRSIVSPTDAGSIGGASPLVSILVPARNEAGRVLRQAIGSMLAQHYQGCEIIAVDDRSTDDTLDVLNELAVGHPNLRAIRGKELPAGWTLGKIFALEQASKSAAGEWLLIADADLIFHRAAVSSLLRFAEQHQCDVLSVEVGKDCQSFWEKLIVPIHDFFTRLTIFFSRVNEPGNQRAFSLGACILIRRSVLESIGGFAAIKDQVPDGLALTCRAKQAGYRFLAAEAHDLFHTRGYASFREIWENDRRCVVITFGKKMIYLLPAAIIQLFFTVVPALVMVVGLVLLLVGNSSPVLSVALPATAAYGCMVCAQVAMCRQAKVSLKYAFLSPLAYATSVLIQVAAFYDSVAGRGIEWKGRRIRVEKQTTACIESSWLGK